MRAVRLSGSVHLVASAETEARLARKNADHPSLPRSLAQIHAQLNSRPDGTPVVPDQTGQRGDRSLLVHGSTWVMRLYPTDPFKGTRRGYVIAAIEPLRLRDHGRLAKGYLSVRPRSWELVSTIRELGDHADARYERLLDEWAAYTAQQAAAQPQPARLPPHHAAFLDTLEQVIEANERITTAQIRAAHPFPYREVKPVGERRHSTHSAYEFVLTGPVPEEDAFVQVRGEPEQRGQVTRKHNRSATVRFDTPVDWERIPKVGELELTPSTVVFRKQREAVTMLRDGESRNPAVLDVLVDHRTHRLAPAPDDPEIRLDNSQLHAFRSALGVPDLMAILGPPGTGKTRVISQIANAAAVGRPGRAPQRVLVTSHTNRAVDNVLQRLPAELVVVRVGGGSVTDEGRPYLLETQARELRNRILGTVAAALDGLRHLEVADRWAIELGDRTATFGAAVAESARTREQFDSARRAAGGSAATELDRLAAAQGKRVRRLAHLDQATQRAFSRAKGSGLLARFWQWRRGRPLVRAQRLCAEQEQAAVAVATATRRLDEITRDVPAVRAAWDELTSATARAGKARTEAFGAAYSARTVVGSHRPPALHDGGTDEEAHAQLTGLSAWLVEWIPVLHRRAQLLSEWQREVSGATSQLYPELIRYADVIAATAIGTASRPELSDVDFDLVIVEEAGQIGTADVLVPLVRARKAVLVGDHQQLPPYLDSEVEVWGKDVGDPTMRLLLSHSALELLVGRLPGANVAPLTEQRRMPKVIAEFISQTYYDKGLGTAVERDHDDRLFASPFAFVDTARLADGRRRERSAGARDRGQRGYYNKAEADLLVKLAAHYDRLGREWAVIVPYRAQVKEITTALVRRIGQDDKVRLDVGSVDSFQGGERDVILYGFTRSNPDGYVGFLSELRRANVAFTRAKRQLVLVGDLNTLTTARDQPFRELACALRDYVARHGDVRQYEEIDAKL
ncbi:MAG: AAA family ATPase [Actinophytocola sp.]|uniref:DEAD/DEAH box helicase n=1 Tax=Actinophytocola sp. TaxID=1872138 RepID=UPI001323FB22|nr:AAA domain-containing protein [Actinophytocola sp.]MPZ83878.1 AAA family ATPase [Actinophytocola sp.]